MAAPAESDTDRHDPFFDVRQLDSRAAPAVRPKPAATLILVRRDRGGPEFLLGKRHRKHKFMPDLFVFPGGRLSYADHRLKTDGTLPAQTEAAFCRCGSAKQAVPLGLCAIREAFEETGILLGAKDVPPPATRAPEWAPFTDLGAAPDLGRLQLVARAITPPPLPRRFDTWFFLAELAPEETAPQAGATGELLDLTWAGPGAADDLPLPSITRQVIRDAGAYLQRQERGNGHGQARTPFYRFRHGKPAIETL